MRRKASIIVYNSLIRFHFETCMLSCTGLFTERVSQEEGI